MSESGPEPESTDLRRTYRALQNSGPEGCPPPDALTALAAGDLGGEERRKIADHVVRCRACSDNTQILMQTHAAAAGRQFAAASRLRVVFILAAAAAVAFLAARLLIAPRTEPSIERGPAAAAQVVPADGTALPGAPDQFAWPAERDAEGYRVKLFDNTGEPLWQSESTRETRMALPPAERARLKPGQSYFWNVEVEGRLEKRRVGPFRFRISS